MSCSKTDLIRHCIALKLQTDGTCKQLAERVNKELKYGYWWFCKYGNLYRNTRNISRYKNKHTNNKENKVCPECKEEKEISKFRTLNGCYKRKCVECRRKELKNEETECE